jgi:hypothetical protein
MPRTDITYRDAPALAPTVLVTRGEDPASLAVKSTATRTAADGAHDHRGTPTAAVAGS